LHIAWQSKQKRAPADWSTKQGSRKQPETGTDSTAAHAVEGKNLVLDKEKVKDLFLFAKFER